ncbi:PcfB family protein [Enterocloster bolteae]|uniref:PcfB family protein n=1 Tax=Enterocloster bolteae TaxID=208479 RepID=UPI002901BB55|nr:PcfB family protein [Enterocloster bolteae]MDU1141535.1 PcfB family protein [Enterocloster bolteae]
MQEEVENRTVNLAISTTKLTGRALLSAFRKYLQYRKSRKAEKSVGEQTIGELLGQNQGASNIEIEKTDIQGFKKILGKYGIDYAITKDPSQTPNRYLVFFKARDGDAMTAAFKEYSASLMQKQRKPSVLQQLHKLKQLAASMPVKVKQKKQERDL